MLRTPCYVVSDSHLGVATAERERMLLGFLRHVAGDAGALVVNGDLFDFWFEWKRVMPRHGFRILAAIADLTESGIPVLYLGGNHDCWGGAALRKDAGVTFHLGGWSGAVGRWRIRIDHGDGLREVEDRGYRRLRTVLRNPWAIRAFRVLPAQFTSWLALRSSDASRTYKPKDNGEGLRQVALRTLSDDPELDLLIFGHSHVPALERSTLGSIYANAGNWLDDATALRIDEASVSLLRWTGAGVVEIGRLERATATRQ